MRRNPYVLGGWVTGPEFYGRGRILDEILRGPNNAIWLMGTRRIGKTSVLRELERRAQEGRRWVPFFLDLQGVDRSDLLDEEVYYALEEQAERFSPFGVVPQQLRTLTAHQVFRELYYALQGQNRGLLLLVDESEAFITMARKDPTTLQRLHRVILSTPGVRTVLAATKRLSLLNDLSKDWLTSPLLHGFTPVYLSNLSAPETEALARQIHRRPPVEASPDTIQRIYRETGGHPYLVQLVCHRLYRPEEHALAPAEDSYFAVEPFLGDFFRIDFGHLTSTERLLVAAVAREEPVPLSRLLDLSPLPPAETRALLYPLVQLGFLHEERDAYTMGNRFFARWLQESWAELEAAPVSTASDAAMTDVVVESRERRLQGLREELEIQLRNRQELERQRALFGPTPPLFILNSLHQVEAEIQRLQREIACLEDMHQGTGARGDRLGSTPVTR